MRDLDQGALAHLVTWTILNYIDPNYKPQVINVRIHGPKIIDNRNNPIIQRDRVRVA